MSAALMEGFALDHALMEEVRVSLRRDRSNYSISRRELSDVSREVARIRRAREIPSKRIQDALRSALRFTAKDRRALIRSIRSAETLLGREHRV